MFNLTVELDPLVVSSVSLLERSGDTNHSTKSSNPGTVSKGSQMNSMLEAKSKYNVVETWRYMQGGYGRGNLSTTAEIVRHE